MNNPSPIQHICFDLDGTLTDSINTIFQATVKTLEQLKIPNKLSIKEFRKIIGYHFQDMFDSLSIPVTDFEEYITIYKNYYSQLMDLSSVFPSVAETLKILKEMGIKISLCTTKVQDQADKVVKSFQIDEFFSLVLGRRENIANKPSAEPLLFICNELNVKPENTLMVGDTELDIRCGKSAGAKTCAVSYGYRELKIIKEENPDYIINDITELINLVKKSNKIQSI
jgi:phosphoglycolate phosphatase/pyrophosphatase PpaX